MALQYGYGSTLGEWVSMIISQLGMALAGLSCILGDCKYWNILIVVLVEYTSLREGSSYRIG